MDLHDVVDQIDSALTTLITTHLTESSALPDMVQDVKFFHKKMGVEHLSKPGLLNDSLLHYRAKFLQEELDEFVDANDSGNLVGAVDGLLDMVYVALGTLDLMGLSTEQIKGCWQAIQEANMTKRRAESVSESKRGHTLDVVKPEGWEGPEEKMAVLLGLDVV